ncbi:MAG TPA: DUF6114 domain-containing protein [Thermomonospora sp.]|nr:DUF6114 domain-containing protein [Thermomonospora sp.]
MSASDPAPATLGRRAAFRAWRRSRPWWGALLVIAGGAELAVAAVVPLGLVAHHGVAGVSGQALGLLLAAAGALVLARPAQHAFLGVTAVVLGLVSLVTSNLGGFLVGALAAITGGVVCFAWTNRPAAPATKSLAVGLAVLPLAPPGPVPEPPVSTVPQVLAARSITAYGVRLDGVHPMPTATGTRPMLRLRLESAELRQVRHTIAGGRPRLAQRAPLILLDHGVTFHTTRLSGLLLGGVPLTLSAAAPLPALPVPLPVLHLTNVTGDQVHLRAGRAWAPGLTLRAHAR